MTLKVEVVIVAQNKQYNYKKLEMLQKLFSGVSFHHLCEVYGIGLLCMI